jgi:glutaminase
MMSARGNGLLAAPLIFGVGLCLGGAAQAGSLPSGAQEILQEVHAKYAKVDEGEVASYIPELTKQDPALFGITIVTVEGQVLTVGDSEAPFTIQSIAKPFVYGLALQDNGREAMLEKVGLEPTGLPFNSILALDIRSSKLQNPLVNAGAIATASLIQGKKSDQKYARVEKMFSSYFGGKAVVDEAVYESEMATNAKNMALAYQLLNEGLLYDDPCDAVDRYTRAGSINVTARTLALAGATLANAGMHPVTKKRALDADLVDEVLSAMLMAGMYDYSGTWMYQVGVPAKSGVGGGIVAVVPGRFAIAIFSPRVDGNGNSVRGVMAVEDLAARWDLHLFHRD